MTEGTAPGQTESAPRAKVSAEFVTTTLTAEHRVDDFDSGEPETDQWLRHRAWRSQRQGSARTRVLVRPGDRSVLGFYAIAPHDTQREDLPGSAAGGLTVVPGYLIAQLAVDRSLQGLGLGGELLLDALETIVAAAGSVGGRLVVVDAVHESAVRFYERYGFIRVGASQRLYLKISRAAASLNL
ncbi:MAG: GNAT family N-acetyltransferase [Propionibacteriaceae bacterium]|nr:GNAT family N-acetyltransferase [Propionibacteriaceae bacterium]